MEGFVEIVRRVQVNVKHTQVNLPKSIYQSQFPLRPNWPPGTIQFNSIQFNAQWPSGPVAQWPSGPVASTYSTQCPPVHPTNKQKKCTPITHPVAVVLTCRRPRG